MSKSQTTLQAEIVAIAPNDASGLTQGLHEALRILCKCTSLETLNAYESVVDAMAVEGIAVDSGADRASPTSVRASFKSDSSGLTQGIQHFLPIMFYNSVNITSAWDRMAAFVNVAIVEIDARKAAL